MTAKEVDRRFLPRKKAQVYSPGRHMIFTKNPRDLTDGYNPESIHFIKAEIPVLTPGMNGVWSKRYKRNFPNGVKRAGKFPGTQGPWRHEGELIVPIFDSGFLDWKLTLPWDDECDTELSVQSVRPYLNIHHVPLTEDGHLIYATRENQRVSWSNSVLCLHSWGYDIDRDGVHERVMDELLGDNGYALFKQSQLAVLREFNPAGGPAILEPHEVLVENASCMSLHVQPKDFGWHIHFVTRIAREAGELLEKRDEYPYTGRVSRCHKWLFTEESMAEFFKKYSDVVATTVEPAIIMACVQTFGPDFLRQLPYSCEY